MAVVNRFYNPRQINRIDPINFQELAFVPQQMRQLHDQTANVASENAINQANVLEQDSALAQELYAPVEKNFNDSIDKLSKSGFSQDIKGEVIKLLGQKKRLERDKISKLEARKSSFQKEVERRKEFFKDDPESYRASIALLQKNLAEQGASSLDENGELNVAGVPNSFFSKVMSSEELAKLENDAFKTLEAEGHFAGAEVGTIKNLPHFYRLLRENKTKGIDPGRIQARLESIMGQDITNSYKQQAINSGLGINPNIDNEWKTQQLSEIEKRLEAQEGATPENTKKQIDSIKELSAVDLYAKLQRNNRIQLSSGALAYQTDETKLSTIFDKSSFAAYNRSLDKSMQTISPSIPGIKMNTETLSPLYGERFGQEKHGILDALLGKEDALRTQVLEENDLEQIGRYVFATKEDGTKFRVLDSHVNKLIKQKEKMLENPSTNPKVQKFINDNQHLKDYVSREISNRGEKAREEIYKEVVKQVNDFYENIGSNYNMGLVLPSDVAKEAKNLYHGKMSRFKIVDPEKGVLTFEQFLENENLTAEEFYDTFDPSVTRNVFGHGNMVEVGYKDKKGKERGIFVESPAEITVDTEKSARVDNILASGDFNKKLEENITLGEEQGKLAGRVVDEYVVPDFQAGKVFLQSRDAKTGEVLGQYDLQELLRLEDRDANNQWKNLFELEGKAN